MVFIKNNKYKFQKGHKVPQEWKDKLSKIHKGKHYSSNTEFKKGRKNSEEFKRLLSERMKGNKYTLGMTSPRKGVKLSEETI